MWFLARRDVLRFKQILWAPFSASLHRCRSRYAFSHTEYVSFFAHSIYTKLHIKPFCGFNKLLRSLNPIGFIVHCLKCKHNFDCLRRIVALRDFVHILTEWKNKTFSFHSFTKNIICELLWLKTFLLDFSFCLYAFLCSRRLRGSIKATLFYCTKIITFFHFFSSDSQTMLMDIACT